MSSYPLLSNKKTYKKKIRCVDSCWASSTDNISRNNCIQKCEIIDCKLKCLTYDCIRECNSITNTTVRVLNNYISQRPKPFS